MGWDVATFGKVAGSKSVRRKGRKKERRLVRLAELAPSTLQAAQKGCVKRMICSKDLRWMELKREGGVARKLGKSSHYMQGGSIEDEEEGDIAVSSASIRRRWECLSLEKKQKRKRVRRKQQKYNRSKIKVQRQRNSAILTRCQDEVAKPKRSWSWSWSWSW